MAGERSAGNGSSARARVRSAVLILLIPLATLLMYSVIRGSALSLRRESAAAADLLGIALSAVLFAGFCGLFFGLRRSGMPRIVVLAPLVAAGGALLQMLARILYPHSAALPLLWGGAVLFLAATAVAVVGLVQRMKAV